MDININVTFGADPEFSKLISTLLGAVSIRTVMTHADPKELPADAGDLFEKKLAEKTKAYVKNYEARLDAKKLEKAEKVASSKPTPVEKTVEKRSPLPRKKSPRRIQRKKSRVQSSSSCAEP